MLTYIVFSDHLKLTTLFHFESFAGNYNAAIVCLGAKSIMLPELSGKIPLRLCRGVISQLQLPAMSTIRCDHLRETSPDIELLICRFCDYLS